MTLTSKDKSARIPVSDHLSSRSIRFFDADCAHEFVLRELIKLLPCDPALTFTAIHEREQKGSTVVTPSIAFPHAKLPGLIRIEAALGICPSGVRIQANDEPVRLFFLFAGPEDISNHLRFLTNASSVFLKDNFLDELLELATPESVWLKIIESEAGKSNAQRALINA